MLRNKTLTELRAIYQGYGGTDFLNKTQIELIQAIELKQAEIKPAETIEIPRPEYDARLMTKTPSRKSDQQAVLDLLKEHIARGLRVNFPDPEHWEMGWDKRTDSGTMRMPLRVVLSCADQIMK